MNKDNDTSKLAALEHHSTRADRELDAATGGAWPVGYAIAAMRASSSPSVSEITITKVTDCSSN
jgi:hypothetical protein